MDPDIVALSGFGDRRNPIKNSYLDNPYSDCRKYTDIGLTKYVAKKHQRNGLISLFLMIFPMIPWFLDNGGTAIASSLAVIVRFGRSQIATVGLLTVRRSVCDDIHCRHCELGQY
ncbi:MAG: hypothetical protein AAGH76_12105 [Pseudomonadota bacterium]